MSPWVPDLRHFGTFFTGGFQRSNLAHCRVKSLNLSGIWKKFQGIFHRKVYFHFGSILKDLVKSFCGFGQVGVITGQGQGTPHFVPNFST
jgi:hypothetical protein